MSKKKGKAADKPVLTPMQAAVAKVERRRAALYEALGMLDSWKHKVAHAHLELQEADAERMKLAITEVTASTANL